jgi:hypothetical protein
LFLGECHKANQAKRKQKINAAGIEKPKTMQLLTKVRMSAHHFRISKTTQIHLF